MIRIPNCTLLFWKNRSAYQAAKDRMLPGSDTDSVKGNVDFKIKFILGKYKRRKVNIDNGFQELSENSEIGFA